MNFEKLLPSLSEHPFVLRWLYHKQRQGCADSTLLDYTRTLIDYTGFCHKNDIDHTCATQEHIMQYVDELFRRTITRGTAVRQGVSTATCRKKLVPLRLYYDFLRSIDPQKNTSVL